MAAKKQTRDRQSKADDSPVESVRSLEFFKDPARFLWLGVLVLVTIVVFVPVRNHQFLGWDDNINVTENPRLLPVSWDKVAGFWTEPYQGLYAPVCYTLFAMEAYFAEQDEEDEGSRVQLDDGAAQSRAKRAGIPQLSPTLFHVVDLVLHVLNVVLVFTILRRLIPHNGAAALGAMLYAVHPLQVESVAWITETRGLLAAAFGWTAVWQYLVFVGAGPIVEVPQAKRSDRRQQEGHWGNIVVATVAFVLALLSKPSAVAIPLIVVVLDVLLVRSRAWKLTLVAGSWAALAAFTTFITRDAQSNFVSKVSYSVMNAPFVAGDAMAFYFGKLALPVGLVPDYGRSVDWVPTTPWFHLMWLVPLAVLLIAAVPKGRRIWLAAALLFIVGVLPVLGLVPFGYQSKSTVADRYVYLSMLGPALALSALLAKRWTAGTAGFACCVLALLALFSFQQSRHWHDNQTLFTYTLKHNPQSYVARTILAAGLHDKEQNAEAEKLLREALEINPDYDRIYGFLVPVLMDQGKSAEADAMVDESLALLPESKFLRQQFAAIYANLGTRCLKEERSEDALDYFHRAIEIMPELATAHYMLGSAYASKEEFGKARKEMATALALAEEAENEKEILLYQYTLGKIAYHLEDYEQAAENLAPVIEKEPRVLDVYELLAQADFKIGRGPEGMDVYWKFLEVLRTADSRAGQKRAQVGAQIAWMLATHPDTRVRDGHRAIALATTLCEKTQYENFSALDVLAAGMATVDRFDEAVAVIDKAIPLAKTYGTPERLQELEARRELYLGKKAYVDMKLAPEPRYQKSASDS